MLSAEDLETLISAKKREIQKEKIVLGLEEPSEDLKDQKEKSKTFSKQSVRFKETSDRSIIDHYAEIEKDKAKHRQELCELEERLPAGLERYIRRYIGLPVMLKAGEYSPNNPLVRSEHVAGDALLGLGEYERRRNTLRKIRQAQYREYLDQQAKKKQEAKEQAARERKQREEKEKEREERERQLLLEREAYSPERRRASLSCIPVGGSVGTTKVDTAVQVDRNSHPLSVAVQTDDAELYRIGECSWLAAERELSPRAAAPSSGQICDKQGTSTIDRRRSYGDYDEHTSSVKKSARDKLTSDLRHTYMPSIFDADAIEMRNLQAQKEAAERRQFYQQELKNQIMEQQRIREERKTREKMLEQAEMRRLEEQLRMLKMAQEKEIIRHGDIESAMKNNERDYDTRRAHLQTEIDIEQDKLFRSKSQPLTHTNKRPIVTSKSDNQRSKLPFFYPHADKTFKPIEIERDRKPYSFNISDNSVFSKNYDVDTYLRKNLNFKEKNLDSGDAVKVYKDLDNESQRIVEKALVHEPKERFYGKTKSKDFMDRVERQIESDSRRIDSENRRIESENKRIEAENRKIDSDNRRLDSENRRIDADRNLESESRLLESEKLISTVDMTDKRSRTEKRKSDSERIDERISIPLLRHSPSKQQESIEEPNDMSDAMKTIDNKWKVPAVQKNILKSMPNDEGKNISILTQLGSIRRQLQLEQLKLDKMHTVKT